MPMLCGSGARLLRNFDRWISMGRRLRCLGLELVSYMDRPVPPSGVAVSIFQMVRPAANGTITLPTCQGERSSRLPPSVSSGLGWRQASVRWCSRSCQNCLIKSTHWAHPAYTVISALRRRALVGHRYVADRRDPSLLMSH